MTVVASLPTTVTTNHQNEKHRKSPSILVSDASKARLFLALACFWPLVIMVLFAASSPQLKDVRSHPRELLDTSNTINQDVRYTFRSIMDRVDIMGYGPTHPRIAVVVVGEDNRSILTSVGSLFSYVKLRDNSFTAAAAAAAAVVVVDDDDGFRLRFEILQRMWTNLPLFSCCAVPSNMTNTLYIIQPINNQQSNIYIIST